MVSDQHWPEAVEAQRRLIALLPDRAEERWWLADFESQIAGSWRPADDFMASLTPAERETPAGIYFRKGWARYRGDAAEYHRLDAIQPWWTGVQEPYHEALIAGVMSFLAGDLPAARTRASSRARRRRRRLARSSSPGA